MAVKIYDNTQQAFVDADIPKVYSAGDGAFVDAGGKVKVGNEWEDVFSGILMIYDNGSTRVVLDNTNKTFKPYGQSLSSYYGTLTYNAKSISWSQSTISGSIIFSGVCTNEKIDVTNYNKLVVETVSSDNIQIGLSDTKTPESRYMNGFVKWKSYNQNGILELDISEVNQERYICAFSGNSANVELAKIYLER